MRQCRTGETQDYITPTACAGAKRRQNAAQQRPTADPAEHAAPHRGGQKDKDQYRQHTPPHCGSGTLRGSSGAPQVEREGSTRRGEEGDKGSPGMGGRRDATPPTKSGNILPPERGTYNQRLKPLVVGCRTSLSVA